jgi:hypothetical protein
VQHRFDRGTGHAVGLGHAGRQRRDRGTCIQAQPGPARAQLPAAGWEEFAEIPLWQRQLAVDSGQQPRLGPLQTSAPEPSGGVSFAEFTQRHTSTPLIFCINLRPFGIALESAYC